MPIIRAWLFPHRDGEVFIRVQRGGRHPSHWFDIGNFPYNRADKVVKEKLMSLGGTGAVIALDKKGEFAAPYSTETLFYGTVTKDGKYKIVLFPRRRKIGTDRQKRSRSSSFLDIYFTNPKRLNTSIFQCNVHVQYEKDRSGEGYLGWEELEGLK